MEALSTRLIKVVAEWEILPIYDRYANDCLMTLMTSISWGFQSCEPYLRNGLQKSLIDEKSRTGTRTSVNIIASTVFCTSHKLQVRKSYEQPILCYNTLTDEYVRQRLSTQVPARERNGCDDILGVRRNFNMTLS